MSHGIFAPPTALAGARTYEPGYRPWIAFQGLGAPNSPLVSMAPSWVPTAVVGGALAIVAAALAVQAGMGYYVGKHLGTSWGWFWGMGGPVGLALMQGYRQMTGKVAVPNRRRRRLSRRRRHARRSR